MWNSNEQCDEENYILYNFAWGQIRVYLELLCTEIINISSTGYNQQRTQLGEVKN